MPVYQEGYRRYEARQPLRTVRFWPITREALAALGARKLVLVALVILMLVAFVPSLFGLIYIGVMSQAQNAPQQMALDGRLFGVVLDAQGYFVFLMTVFAGAGLVANDLRSGGILLYLSRPLSLRDYVFGKLAALLSLQLAVTLVPVLLLYVAALGLAPERFARWDLAWIAPAILLQSLLVSMSFSLVALALSSLARSARLAALMFFGGLMLMALLAQGIQAALGRTWPGILSLWMLLHSVNVALFGSVERVSVPAVHWALALVVLAAVALGSLLVLRARVRAVEVVG